MKLFKPWLIGLILMLIGIALFIFIVPTVGNNDLGFREYFWAMVIIFFTCMGFGLIMIRIFGREEDLDAKF